MKTKTGFLAVLILILAACGTNEPPIIQATSTPQPSPTSTATLLPTLTLGPNQSVLDDQGLELLLDTYKGLYLYDVDSRQSTKIASGMQSGFPFCWEWSPDGQFLLYRTDNPSGSRTAHTLNIYDPKSGESRVLVETNSRYFHWHPNGKAILLGNTFIDAITGNVLVEFQSNDFPTAEWPRAAFSPDGSQVILVSPYFNTAYLADIQVDSSGQVSGISSFTGLNLSLGGRSIMDVQWNPQGDQIAFKAIDLNTNKGDTLLFTLSDNRLQNLTAGMTTVPGHAMIASPITWSPDGTRIAFTFYEQRSGQPFENPRIYIVNIETSEILEITGGDYPSGSDAFWSSDSQSLIFITNPNGDVVACRADGTDKRLVTDDPGMIYYGAFRP